MKFMQIKPQKARGVLKVAYWTDPAWVAEEKYDGDRRIMQVCDGFPRFTGTRQSVDGGRYVEKTDCLPHLGGSIKALEGTVLDGEIVAPFAKNLPGGKSKYVTSIMGSSPEEAIRKQKEHGWLEYMVFDCLWYKGTDIRGHNLAARRIAAGQAVKEWKNSYASLVPWINEYMNDRKKAFENLVAQGHEGVILKHRDHTYGDESLWVKVKGEWTADVVIMGFEPGKGKYEGMVGAIVFGQHVPGTVTGTAAKGKLYLTKLGTCRGFTDALMQAMTRHPKDYLNKVIEIDHNGREPTGAFRHPRFSRFRPDKSPKDCVYREDET